MTLSILCQFDPNLHRNVLRAYLAPLLIGVLYVIPNSGITEVGAAGQMVMLNGKSHERGSGELHRQSDPSSQAVETDVSPYTHTLMKPAEQATHTIIPRPE